MGRHTDTIPNSPAENAVQLVAVGRPFQELKVTCDYAEESETGDKVEDTVLKPESRQKYDGRVGDKRDGHWRGRRCP